MAYIVRQIDTETHDTVYAMADDTSAMLGGMSPGTTYDIAVAALCGGDTTSWFSIGMVTTEVSCRQPMEAEVAALTSTAAGLTWRYDYGGINNPTGMLLKLAGSNNADTVFTFSTSGEYLFIDSLATGYIYTATLSTLCSNDTAVPLSLTFRPLSEACSESSGTNTSLVVPMAVASPYSYSQSLYPASLLTGMSSLYAIAVRVVGTPILYSQRTIDIYVGQTTDSTLNENISTMTAQCAAYGMTVNPDGSGWLLLPFDLPVTVNPQQNLLITIVDRTGTMGGQMRFGTGYSSFGGTLYGVSTEMPFDPSMSELSLTFTSALPDVQLFGNCAAPSCVAPAAMVTNASPTTLTLGWIGAEGSCSVRYRADGEEQWTTTAPHVDSCLLSGLNPATRYELSVGAICGADTAYGAEFEAYTVCGIVSTPYLADFTHGASPCWQGYQNTFDGGVRLGSMIVSPEIGQAANTLQVTISVAGYGMLYMGVCDADGENMQWVDTMYIDYAGTHVVYLDGYTGTSRRIALVGNSASVVLREVLIEQLDDCLPPRNLAVTNVNGTGATLTWYGTAALYEVYIVEEGSGLWSSWQTTETHFTFNGLAGNTLYHGYVVSLCGGTYSLAYEFSFVTDCEAIAYFPYYEGFESPQAPAQCWNLAYADPANAMANPMAHVGGVACEGNYSFRFSSYNYIQSDIYDQYLISPRIVADDSIWLQFSYRKDNMEAEPFSVGFSTSGNAIGDFLWLSTDQAVLGEWRQYSIGLPAATRYVAIHYMGQNSYYLYIDDLRITGPGCEPPVFTTVDEQSESVTIGWAAETDTSYVYITEGLWLNNVDGIAVLGDEYTFSGLESGHYYTVGVRTRCLDGRLSDWTTRRVVTISTSCQAPTGLTATEVDFTTAEIAWQPVGGAEWWQLCLLADGMLVDISQPLGTPQGMIVGLEQGADYGVMVRSLCSGIPGPWSDTLFFRTHECSTVSDLSFERVDFRTVSLIWQEAEVSTGMHRVEYGLHGFVRGSGTVVEAAGMPLVIGNLEPEPTYDFYIQNYCRPGVLSEAAEMITVPSGMGIDESAGSVSGMTIYPSPATTKVTVEGVAMGVMVEVLDLSGRIVAGFMPHSSSLAIDVSDYPVGTYFIRVTDTVRTVVGRFNVVR